MGEGLYLDIVQAFNFLKKYGIQRIFEAVTLLSWFIFPFLIWVMIYDWLGTSFVLVEWGLIGALVTLVVVLASAFFEVKNIQLKGKLAKHVETARRVFNNPADADCEKNFHDECGKFILPYLHYRKLNTLGFVSVMKSPRRAARIYINVVYVLTNLLLSYLFFLFLVNNQALFKSIVDWFAPTLDYFAPLTSIPLIVYQHILPISFIFFFFCTYFSVKLYKEITGFPESIFHVVSDYFSIFYRVGVTGAFVLSSPWSIRERMRGLRYSPFTLQTMTTIEIIKKSVEDIERTQCQVTVWQYELDTIDDVEQLKKMILDRKEIPSYMRGYCLRASSEDILKSVNETKPILFLGLVDKRCAVVGRVKRDEKERMYRAVFSFDNRYVKDMFKSIVDVQIETQKKLSSTIPNTIAEVVQKLNVSGSD